MATLEELEKLILELKQGPAVPAPVPTDPTKLDLGCGTNKKAGFFGVDSRPFAGVDLVLDIGRHRWPWEDNTIEEAYCSHTIEHLEWEERVHFFNELYRVLKPDATAQIIVPHWASARYYGDPTHKSAFSEWAWLYLDKEWRKTQAPHCDAEMSPGPLAYSCDFPQNVPGFSMAPWMVGRSTEFQQFAFAAYKEAAQDMIMTLKKRSPK